MKIIWQSSRTLAIAVVATVAAGAAVVVGCPHAVSEPLMGPEWQCSRVAFLVTTCSQSREAVTHWGAAVDEARKMAATARTIQR